MMERRKSLGVSSRAGDGRTTNAFFAFLKEMFTLTPVWVDRGHGRWVMRRRMHPLMRTILAVGLMAVGIAWGLDRFMGAPAPETPQAPIRAEPQPQVQPQPQPQSQPQTQIHDRSQARPRQEAVSPPRLMELPPLKDIVVAEPENSARGGNPGEYWVRISKGDCTLSLYRGDELVKNYSVAVGRNPGNKRRIGDNRTPVGQFRVQSIENSQRWKHDFGDGNGMIDGAYGPWFIRLDTGWKGIGIHGTHDPDSRGSMATEGCIRMSNEEVQELKRYAYRNMKVVIEE